MGLCSLKFCGIACIVAGTASIAQAVPLQRMPACERGMDASLSQVLEISDQASALVPFVESRPGESAKVERLLELLDGFDHFNDISGRALYQEGLADYSGSTLKRHGLTEAEVLAIRGYTAGFYGPLNAALRGGTDYSGLKRDDALFYSGIMSSGLAKLPPYRGPVIRYVSLPLEVLEQHRPGETVTYSSYTSTSRDPAFNWGPNGQKLLIQSKTGKLIEEISHSRAEQEVLFPPGTRFKVLERTTAGKRTTLVLEELGP